MALDATQKQQILYYCGLSDKNIAVTPEQSRQDSSEYNQSTSILYSSLVARDLDNISPESETQAISLLQRCQNIDQQLAQATSRLTVGSVGNIRLNRREISMLRGERRRVESELQQVVFPFLDLSLLQQWGDV